MNRRNFLSFLGAAAATATLDPERMLWNPTARKIFIPPASDTAIQAYVEFCHRQAMETFSVYLDAMVNVPSPFSQSVLFGITNPRTGLFGIDYCTIKESGHYPAVIHLVS